jgi:carbon storage regulator CsrA
MLVLSRRVNEKIIVPSHGVTLVVLEIKGKKVRLGISTPADVRIARYELLLDHNAATDHRPNLFDSSMDLPPVTGV